MKSVFLRYLEYRLSKAIMRSFSFKTALLTLPIPIRAIRNPSFGFSFVAWLLLGPSDSEICAHGANVLPPEGVVEVELPCIYGLIIQVTKLNEVRLVSLQLLQRLFLGVQL